TTEKHHCLALILTHHRSLLEVPSGDDPALAIPLQRPMQSLRDADMRLPAQFGAGLRRAVQCWPADQPHHIARDVRRTLQPDHTADYLRQQSGPEGEPQGDVPRHARLAQLAGEQVDQLALRDLAGTAEIVRLADCAGTARGANGSV